MNLRTIALGAIAMVAFGTSAASLAQTAPGAQGTPPPPPLPNTTSQTPSAVIAPTTVPTALPTNVSPPTTAPVSPAPQTSGRGRRGRHSESPATPAPNASPTDTPAPPQFSTLDGVWEVQLQPTAPARTVYSHLYVTQTGNTVTGTWRRDAKTSVPFTGTFDGRLLKMTATDGTNTFVFSGYEENFMDMVGMLTDGDPKHPGTPFTAAHRKKEKVSK